MKNGEKKNTLLSKSTFWSRNTDKYSLTFTRRTQNWKLNLERNLSCVSMNSDSFWKGPIWQEIWFWKETYFWVLTLLWWPKWMNWKVRGSPKWLKSSLLKQWQDVQASSLKLALYRLRSIWMRFISNWSGWSMNWKTPVAVRKSSYFSMKKAQSSIKTKMRNENKFRCKINTWVGWAF